MAGMFQLLIYNYIMQTIHSAKGYTPHMLLFGSEPRDQWASLNKNPGPAPLKVEARLQRQRKKLETVHMHVALEHCRASMIATYTGQSKI
jgi:hypothetical protein